MKTFRWKPFGILLFVVLFLGGCASTGVTDPDQLLVRIENGSEMSMSDITVNFVGENINYGTLNAGVVSEYREVKQAYRYAFIELTAGGKELILQPIDFVGESLLEPGKYTYKLGINREIFDRDDPDSRFALFLQLRVD